MSGAKRLVFGSVSAQVAEDQTGRGEVEGGRTAPEVVRRQSGAVDETWVLRDSGAVSADDVTEMLRDRLSHGEHTTWLDSARGRTAGLVTNGTRAMLVVLDFEGDAGVHAADPNGADQMQSGYMLENGQVDSYADRDTVPLDDAAQALAELVRSGSLDPRIYWRSDR